MKAGCPSLPYFAQCGSFPSPGSLSSLETERFRARISVQALISVHIAGH